MQADRQKNLWAWIGLAIVAIAVLLVFDWRPASHPSMTGNAAPTGTPTFAPQGQLTPQFPQELVLDKDAQVISSYSATYSPTVHEYSAVWNTSTSLATLRADYKNYFTSNGWTVSNEMTFSGVDGFHAENATAVVAFSIVDHRTSRTVTIGYSLK
ncbi:MAG TPA: hypothetical protein VMT99_01800 [Candidatus Paceibacterota bacterium]|nr:hypothetical protein [Candidatus Paceibacterota bacterium]